MTTTKFKNLFSLFGLITFFCLFPNILFANQYSVPSGTLIGDISYTRAASGDTLITIGQRYNVGVNGMLGANPGLNEKTPLPAGMPIKIPSLFLLPSLPRKGIVINLAEMRMYYFTDNTVMTFPVGIGRVGKTIPMGPTAISYKKVNPTWTPPDDIREFNRNQGIELPTQMGPGPDNPLGPYAIYLKVPTYLIHSTIFPESIGTRASFGCIRMNEYDIKQFFPSVEPGTPVSIVNIASKVGWEGDQLFLEAHLPLEEHEDKGLSGVVNSIQQSVPKQGVTLINWQAVSFLAEQRDGIPHEIGFKAR